MVLRAVDFAFDLNLRIQEQFFTTVPIAGRRHAEPLRPMAFRGGLYSESLDAFHMTSVAYFERWGREPAALVMNRFDGGRNPSPRQRPPSARSGGMLRGLVALRMMDDRGFPSAFDIVDQLQACG